VSVAGRIYLIDTSALARAHMAQVRYTVQTLLTDRVAATCVTVDLAAGYSGRTAADLGAIDARRRDRYLNLPLNEEIAIRAREVQAMLAEKMQHRSVGILDLLTAAVAEHHDAALLHYDPAFELIASITGQPQLWVAARGSLEADDLEKAALDAPTQGNSEGHSEGNSKIDSEGSTANGPVPGYATPPPQLPYPMDHPISSQADRES
jgi:predicted nucleic acid-binding protein